MTHQASPTIATAATCSRARSNTASFIVILHERGHHSQHRARFACSLDPKFRRALLKAVSAATRGGMVSVISCPTRSAPPGCCVQSTRSGPRAGASVAGYNACSTSNRRRPIISGPRLRRISMPFETLQHAKREGRRRRRLPARGRGCRRYAYLLGEHLPSSPQHPRPHSV